jgi:hypothetical protein
MSYELLKKKNYLIYFSFFIYNKLINIYYTQLQLQLQLIHIQLQLIHIQILFNFHHLHLIHNIHLVNLKLSGFFHTKYRLLPLFQGHKAYFH